MYNLIEYIAATESKNFDNIDEGMIEWAENFVKSFNNVWLNETHKGDCTNEIQPCNFCVFEGLLTEYRQYFFKNNQITE